MASWDFLTRGHQVPVRLVPTHPCHQNTRLLDDRSILPETRSWNTVFPGPFQQQSGFRESWRRQMSLSLASIRWRAGRDTSVWLKYRAALARDQAVRSKAIDQAVKELWKSLSLAWSRTDGHLLNRTNLQNTMHIFIRPRTEQIA